MVKTSLLENLTLIDDLLRRRPWTTADVRAGPHADAGRVRLRLRLRLRRGDGQLWRPRGRSRLASALPALKAPLLLLATFSIGLPSFFVLNTLFGLRRDFREVLRALAAAQAGLAVVLASCAPLTLFWYASFADYDAALRFNGLVFALASFAAQHLLRGYYRPLIARNQRHRRMLWTWLAIYVFVGIQMAWTLRPFIGAAALRCSSSAAAEWETAYVVVARLIWDVVWK